MILTHYLIVRRDMLITDVLAQLAHAAGESFYRFTGTVHSRVVQLSGRRAPNQCLEMGVEIPPLEPDCRCSSKAEEHADSSREDAGSTPATGPNFDVSQTVVVVKSARSESKLRKLADTLTTAAIPHVAIVETEGVLAGQMTAIGLVPGDKQILSPYLNDFHLFTPEQALT